MSRPGFRPFSEYLEYTDTRSADEDEGLRMSITYNRFEDEQVERLRHATRYRDTGGPWAPARAVP